MNGKPVFTVVVVLIEYLATKPPRAPETRTGQPAHERQGAQQRALTLSICIKCTALPICLTSRRPYGP